MKYIIMDDGEKIDESFDTKAEALEHIKSEMLRYLDAEEVEKQVAILGITEAFKVTVEVVPYAVDVASIIKSDEEDADEDWLTLEDKDEDDEEEDDND